MSDKWKRIADFIKMFLLIATSVNGFFFVYATIWGDVGLPIENWALLILFALACLSFRGLMWWIERGADNER